MTKLGAGAQHDMSENSYRRLSFGQSWMAVSQTHSRELQTAVARDRDLDCVPDSIRKAIEIIARRSYIFAKNWNRITTGGRS